MELYNEIAGLESDSYFINIKLDAYAEMKVLYLYKNIEINIPGRHNVLNTVVALAMANSYGVPLAIIAKALKSFKGIQRRFNYKIKTNNLVLIDDYAHHPTELKAFFDSLDLLYPEEKKTIIFQPHLFTRTQDFMDGFAEQLSRVDHLILMPIYPARELPIEGVTSENLAKKIKTKVSVLNHKDALTLMERIDHKVIATVGAGDIDKLILPLSKILQNKTKG